MCMHRPALGGALRSQINTLNISTPAWGDAPHSVDSYAICLRQPGYNHPSRCCIAFPSSGSRPLSSNPEPFVISLDNTYLPSLPLISPPHPSPIPHSHLATPSPYSSSHSPSPPPPPPPKQPPSTSPPPRAAPQTPSPAPPPTPPPPSPTPSPRPS